MKLAIRKNLINVLAFVGLIWLIYLVGLPLKVMSWDLVSYGMVPRTVRGLIGILTMPFLHDGLDHLLGNTVPLAVLLFMLATSRSNARRIVLGLIVLSGIFIWLIGISSPVVGASGLIYAMTAYLITAGLHERQLISAATAVLVGVLYGGTLFWNLLPTAGKTVAWDAHLLGAAAGAVYAHLTLRKKPTKLRDIRPSDDRNLSPSTIVE
ncbi:MAG: rhomboid family intramembrane serine protease [Planctomycetota bacterium]|nr:MAG: rhomboid family intramembrane serine protease [Planctomycetota bacterium]